MTTVYSAPARRRAVKIKMFGFLSRRYVKSGQNCDGHFDAAQEYNIKTIGLSLPSLAVGRLRRCQCAGQPSIMTTASIPVDSRANRYG